MEVQDRPSPKYAKHEVAWLEALSVHPDPSVRRLAARAERSPERILLALAGDPESTVRKAVALNPSTSAEVRDKLAADRSDGVRLIVAMHQSTLPALLSLLAGDRAWSVRKMVAANPSTPPEALARLVDDEDGLVVRSLTGNLSTPPVALSQLSRHESDYVRRGVASNPSTPPEALRLLADDPDASVRHWISRNPSAQPGISGEPFHAQSDERRWTRLRGARRPNRDRTRDETCRLADCPGHVEPKPCVLPMRELTTRCATGRSDFAYKARGAYSGSWHAQDRLWVKALLAWPGLPHGHIAAAVAAGAPAADVLAVPGLPKTAQEQMALLDDERSPAAFRIRVAATLEEDEARAAVHHPDRVVRLGVALNPRSGDVLALLLDDPDKAVRDAAAERVAAALMPELGIRRARDGDPFG